MTEWNQQPINRSIQDSLQNRYDLYCELWRSCSDTIVAFDAPLKTYDEWLDGTR